MNQRKPGKSTVGMIFLFLLRVQYILPKWYEEAERLCVYCLEDGDLHIPSQPISSHFYLRVEVPGLTLLSICLVFNYHQNVILEFLDFHITFLPLP